MIHNVDQNQVRPKSRLKTQTGRSRKFIYFVPFGFLVFSLHFKDLATAAPVDHGSFKG